MINKIKYATATALVALLPLNSTAAVGNSTCYPFSKKQRQSPENRLADLPHPPPMLEWAPRTAQPP